jgi:hypothetical protein
MRLLIVAGLTTLALYETAQTPKTIRPPVPARTPVPLTKIAADIACATPLGVGVNTREAFCEVTTGRVPADGIVITLPPHEGPARLTFDLHNRHTYSAEEMKEHLAYRRYTATIGLLTMDNTLIGRAIVQSEFRSESDLFDRVRGGGGPGGLKAIALVGIESIAFTIPEREEQVSVLGEKLTVERLGGSTTYSQPGRPIADIGHVLIEYRPAPPPRSGKDTPAAIATTGTKSR